MAEPYLSELKSIVEQLVALRDTMDDITCKHFFSGAAAYVDGHVFMSLSPTGLALKLPVDDLAKLFDQGAKPLQYFPKAPVKKDYAVLPSQVIGDKELLRDWILQSIDFARK